ncbi:hypothetical protein [Flammeovirga sp. OC4]|uniref:hypothetical protein n=1 Tax=Flammeovirga sp. OC4 TaxID=1382345 RepID=UPI0005C50F6E|nr:hypothetical protein [Flammeovirga sp. OC4]
MNLKLTLYLVLFFNFQNDLLINRTILKQIELDREKKENIYIIEYSDKYSWPSDPIGIIISSNQKVVSKKETIYLDDFKVLKFEEEILYYELYNSSTNCVKIFKYNFINNTESFFNICEENYLNFYNQKGELIQDKLQFINWVD